MTKIRQSVADALGIHPDDLGCFTLTDHDGQPAIIVMHGGKAQGVWVEDTEPLTDKAFIRIFEG